MRPLRRTLMRAFGSLLPNRAADWFEMVMQTPTRPGTRPTAVPRSPGVDRRVPYGDGWLSFTEWGTGPGILLVHGWSASASVMWPFVDPVVARGFRAITLDLPAHGRSDGVRTNLVQCGGAILVVGHAAGPLAGIVTHSFGGPVSVLALHHGLRADRLVMLGPPLSVTVAAISVGDALGLPRRVSAGMYDRSADRLGLRPDERTTERAVAGLALPILVIHDRDDPVVPWSHGDAIASAAPGGRLMTTRGLGHRRVLQDVGVIDAVLGFVGGVPRRRLSA
jgi:pimeloyl-ACP methyl ester carboxylesterase